MTPYKSQNAQLDSITYDDVIILRRIKDLYRQITDKLSLSQYEPLMGGDMSYKSKAERAKLVSKSKQVHVWADEIVALYIQLKGGVA